MRIPVLALIFLLVGCGGPEPCRVHNAPPGQRLWEFDPPLTEGEFLEATAAFCVDEVRITNRKPVSWWPM